MELLAVFVVCGRGTGLEWLYRRQAGEPFFKTKVPFRGSVSHAEREWGSAVWDFP